MEPVVTRVRASLNGVQVVVSHSSPSVQAWPLEFADHSDFIPADVRSDATRFLEAVRPSMLVIARRDVWPTIMGIVAAAVPVLIVGARATAPRWSFSRWLSRLYGGVLERVSWVGAVTDADVRAWFAYSLTSAGYYREAVEHFRAAMSLNPFYPNWYRGSLARDLFCLDEFDEALTLLDEVLEAEPANLLAVLNRAYIYEQIGREADARKAISEVRRLAPNLRVSHMPGILLVNDAAALKRYSDGVRKAGLPE